MTQNNLHILKFGGTSMGSATSIRQVTNILTEAKKINSLVVVCSAVSGVTNQLIQLTEISLTGNAKKLNTALQKLRMTHQSILDDLMPETSFLQWEEHFEPQFKKLCYVLQGVRLVGDITDKTRAYITSFGEQMSTQVLTLFLNHQGERSQRFVSDRLVYTDDNYLEATVDLKKTKTSTERILRPILDQKIIPIVTGFLGRGTEKEITLLGRGGSDYTAGILGLCLKAVEVQIWTDVSGIYSADPRIIKEAAIWESIDLAAMSEMAHAGAKVLHPKSICATVEAGIPVRIKNTFAPQDAGTLVTQKPDAQLYGISAETDQVIIHIMSPQMLDSFGFVQQCSQVFVDHKISLDAVTTSEVSISISLPEKNMTKSLLKDLESLARITIHRSITKLSVIGNNITHDAGLLSKVFGALLERKILTQCTNAGGHTLTLFLADADKKEVLKTLHKALFRK
jgi:aspartate kinase